MDSTSYKERVKYFVATLSAMGDDETHSSPVIDMKLFREACFKGIPDEGSCHATAWKVLLGYLPPDKRQWQKTLHDQRLSYYTLVKEMLETPSEKPTNEDDHPLSAMPGSKWATYIQENSVLEQIDKDVRRTLPDFAFFQQRVATNSLNPLSVPPPMPALSNSPGVVVDDPLDAGDVVDAKTSAMRRLSFGLIGGRPRSSSNASRKSNKTTTTSNLNGNRSRSNSRSSARSFSSAKDAASPRSIVRKLSSAFSLSNSTLVKPTKMLTPICPLIPHRRSLFKRIPAQDDHDDTENHEKGEKYENRDSAKGDDVQDYHWEVIERLLFMYAKLNPGVGYVQGMNELLAPIYYLFANDKQPQHAATAFDVAAHAYAEADAFFVFSALMADVRDHFVRSLDQDGLGIHATMLRLQQRLAWYDRPLWRDLQRKQVKEPYYAFRWITVLFTQEWDLPDVIRLWDSLLAERCPQQDTPFEFLLDFAVAMLACIRQPLLEGDFAVNVKLLQNYPIHDIQYVLHMATKVRDRRQFALQHGHAIPGVNDARQSGMLSVGDDWSDTSSIASTASNASSRLQQRLRESTDMARASFDSFRRESRESMDEFRRSWSRRTTTMPTANPTATAAAASITAVGNDMKRSISQRFSLVKNSLANKQQQHQQQQAARRTSSLRSYPLDMDPLADNENRQNHSQNHGNFHQKPTIATNGTASFTNDAYNNSMMQRSQSARSYVDHHRQNTSNAAPTSPTEALFARFSTMNVDNAANTRRTPPSSSSSTLAQNHTRATTNNDAQMAADDNEKLLFAKAAAARDHAFQYRVN